MSRVGKMPVAIPKGVDVAVDAEQINVKGSLGALSRPLSRMVTVKSENGSLSFTPVDDSVEANAMSGTMRALASNMVNGVSKGFEKKLTLVGVGFRAQAAGSKLNLSIGFSHPVSKTMPEGVQVVCPTQTEVVIKGADRQAVGQVASEIRAIRPPEPYKGKGIRYCGREGHDQRDQEEVRSARTCRTRKISGSVAPARPAHASLRSARSG